MLIVQLNCMVILECKQRVHKTLGSLVNFLHAVYNDTLDIRV